MSAFQLKNATGSKLVSICGITECSCVRPRVRDTVRDTVCSLKWRKFLLMGRLSVNDSNFSLLLILSSGFRRRVKYKLWCVFIYLLRFLGHELLLYGK